MTTPLGPPWFLTLVNVSTLTNSGLWGKADSRLVTGKLVNVQISLMHDLQQSFVMQKVKKRCAPIYTVPALYNRDIHSKDTSIWFILVHLFIELSLILILIHFQNSCLIKSKLWHCGVQDPGIFPWHRNSLENQDRSVIPSNTAQTGDVKQQLEINIYFYAVVVH